MFAPLLRSVPILALVAATAPALAEADRLGVGSHGGHVVVYHQREAQQAVGRTARPAIGGGRLENRRGQLGQRERGLLLPRAAPPTCRGLATLL